jgi:predicted enzyme related to lactoylglutathione lyase
MANHHGDFIWYELWTTEADAASDFYGDVIGWQARSAEGSNRDYRIFSIGGVDVAGLLPIPRGAEGTGMRPGWLGYVGVDDVDAAATAIAEAGGEQHLPPTDIPNVGRLAMVSDPQGVLFYVMRGAVEGASTSFTPMKAGHCQWNELQTTDQAAALAFYTGLFGWEKGGAMPMGEMGDYQFINHRSQMIGAMMNRVGNGPPPAWNFYFGVEDIDVAAWAVTQKGGVIHYGPAEVPGGSFIIVGSDPQGAMFALVGPRKP